MNQLKQSPKSTLIDQELANEAYSVLKPLVEQELTAVVSVELLEANLKLTLPSEAIKILAESLRLMSKGRSVAINSQNVEITTQAASELLGCSRPFFVKLLEEGKIPFVKIGRHRRVRYEDVLAYQKLMKIAQRKQLIEIMKTDEELGVYDT